LNVSPQGPGFANARWITSEDVNVEHLLDVFTSIDADSDEVWNACINFMAAPKLAQTAANHSSTKD
jgi:hypothetical protein